MDYRRVGGSGLQVSVLSFGSWVTFGSQVGKELAIECLDLAYREGVNFFDNAEVYSSGESERIMGQAIAELGWPRFSYVISTKLFWGIHNVVNMQNTLNRKYLLQALDGSLERLGLDFVDILYCHRPDPQTPMEEVVWTMSDLVESGKATYWGTSEFSAQELEEVYEVAERYRLRKPIVEQPMYNLFERKKVERDFAPLYDRYGLGLTTFSPLASGLLSGKYIDGMPQDSRAALAGYEWMRGRLIDPTINKKVARLGGVAQNLGCSLSQLAIAWCAANPRVSTVITGASRRSQLEENLAALEVVPLITDDVKVRIDSALA